MTALAKRQPEFRPSANCAQPGFLGSGPHPNQQLSARLSSKVTFLRPDGAARWPPRHFVLAVVAGTVPYPAALAGQLPSHGLKWHTHCASPHVVWTEDAEVDDACVRHGEATTTNWRLAGRARGLGKASCAAKASERKDFRLVESALSGLRRGPLTLLAQRGTSTAHPALLEDGLNCDRHPRRAIRSLQQEVIMDRGMWVAFAIIAILVVGVVALTYHPGGQVTQTGQVTQPPAMNDSSAGSSTGQIGKALPSQTPAKSAPSVPAQPPAQ
jgi:hypothetical protein